MYVPLSWEDAAATLILANVGTGREERQLENGKAALGFHSMSHSLTSRQYTHHSVYCEDLEALYSQLIYPF